MFYDPIHIRDYNYVHIKEVDKGGFRESPHYLNWVATLDLIRPSLEPQP